MLVMWPRQRRLRSTRPQQKKRARNRWLHRARGPICRVNQTLNSTRKLSNSWECIWFCWSAEGDERTVSSRREDEHWGFPDRSRCSTWWRSARRQSHLGGRTKRSRGRLKPRGTHFGEGGTQKGSWQNPSLRRKLRKKPVSTWITEEVKVLKKAYGWVHSSRRTRWGNAPTVWRAMKTNWRWWQSTNHLYEQLWKSRPKKLQSRERARCRM